MIAIAVLLTLPGAARARPIDPRAHTTAAGDPDKQFCVGIKLKDWDLYDGRCRYGAPLMPMKVVSTLLKRPQLGKTLEAGKMKPLYRERLLDQLKIVDKASDKKGKKRIKRLARRARKSWAGRATANCLTLGAAVGGITAIAQLVFTGGVDREVIGQAALGGCAMAVLQPRLDRFLKRHGFDMRA